MGFYHEHVRADRDDYVIVNMTNIKPDAQINYEKLPFEAWLDVESPYDLKFGTIIKTIFYLRMRPQLNFSTINVKKQ